jgi:predicted deacetylase
MALTTAQRNALPASAFVYHSGPRSNWRYPTPTKAQARKAGIGEAQRARTHRAALAYSARSTTRGSPRTVRSAVAARHQGAVRSMSRGRR